MASLTVAPTGAAASGSPSPNGARSVDSVPERVLQAALRLFAEQGFENTSVQEIVDAVGVTKGALYHYFASKDDLLYEIYVRVLHLQTEHLEAIATSDAPVAERLHAMAADVVRTTLANLDGVGIFYRSLHLLSEEKRSALRDQRRKYTTMFQGLIAEGQQVGTFRRSGMPLDLRTYHFFGTVHYLPTWYRPGGPLAAEEIARYYADDLVDSLR